MHVHILGYKSLDTLSLSFYQSCYKISFRPVLIRIYKAYRLVLSNRILSA